MYEQVMFLCECTMAGLFIAITAQNTRVRDIFCFHIPVPRFSGEFNFLETQQTSHGYYGRSLVTAGQQQQRQSRNASEGGLL